MKFPLFLYEKDNGGSGGQGAASGKKEDPKTGDATGAGDGENGGEDLTALKLAPEQQALFESILEKRMTRAQASWQKDAEDAAEVAKKATEEAQLAEKQEFQKLAQRRQGTIEELTIELETAKVTAAQAKKFEKALIGYRDQMIDGVDDSIKALLAPLDVVDQMTWLTENQPKEPGENGKWTGPPPAPGASGTGKMSDEERRKAAYRPRL